MKNLGLLGECGCRYQNSIRLQLTHRLFSAVQGKLICHCRFDIKVLASATQKQIDPTGNCLLLL